MLLTRFYLATRLNCAISQPALGSIDELLIATVAGCAGEASSAHLTVAVQGRTLLAMRYGGTLTGAETSAPAQHLSSVATVESFIVKTEAALAEQGLEPTALRRTGLHTHAGCQLGGRHFHAARDRHRRRRQPTQRRPHRPGRLLKLSI